MEKLEIMEKELKERLESIEDKLQSILSIYGEVYLPDSRKEKQELLRKHNGDISKALYEWNQIWRARHGD